MSHLLHGHSEHDCVFLEDADGGLTCPVCGRYADGDLEDEREDPTMDPMTKFCPMCGAIPGENCTVISGSDDPGDRPGDVRSEPHFYRHNDRPIAVLIPDEPSRAA